MSVNVILREDLNLIEVIFVDVLTIEVLKEARKTVETLANKHKTNRLLVNSSQVTKHPITCDLFEFGESLSESDIHKKIKTAIITSTDKDKDVRFVETVAQNRGVFIKLFYSREDAIEWLNGSSKTVSIRYLIARA